MRTSENSRFQSNLDIDEDCPNERKYIISEGSVDIDLFYDNFAEETLDESFEEMGAVRKDFNSK